MTPPATLESCLCVRLQPLGDADLIVTLLSAERGRLDTLAKAARSSRKRFGGSLRLFSELDVSLGHGRGRLPLLGGATERHAWLTHDVAYEQLCLASYAAELALTASQPEHADLPLHAWLRAAWTLCAGDVRGAVRPLRTSLEVTWLHVLGLLPDVAACVRCGAALTDGAVWLHAGEGLLCRACAPGGAPHVGQAALRALRALVAGTLDGPALQDVLPTDLRVVQERVAQLLAQAIGAPLRSAAALRALIAEA